MKSLKFIAAASLLSIAMAAPTFAQEYTAGEVTKVDTAQKKITIKHGELKNLEMPGMTMVFTVGDDAMLTKVKPGQKIEFTADRVNGRLTVTAIK